MACRILIAHNHEIVRLGIRTILAPQADISICGEAADGIETIKQTFKLRPDIVIADFGIPRANGIILSERLLRWRRRQNLLIFGITESKELVRQLIRVGVRALLAMNDPGAAFVRAVEALRLNRTYFTPFVDAFLLENYRHPNQWVSPGPVEGILSLRQQEVLQLLAEGNSTKEVAVALGLSTKTAETHRSAIMRRLQVHNIAQLTRYALSRDVVSVPVLHFPLADRQVAQDLRPRSNASASVAGMSA